MLPIWRNNIFHNRIVKKSANPCQPHVPWFPCRQHVRLEFFTLKINLKAWFQTPEAQMLAIQSRIENVGFERIESSELNFKMFRIIIGLSMFVKCAIVK